MQVLQLALPEEVPMDEESQMAAVELILLSCIGL